MARPLSKRMSPRRAAEHLVAKRGINAARYARDREDTCKTESDAFFWSRVGDEIGRVLSDAAGKNKR